MAPIIIRRVLDSSIWSALDASKPKLSRRYYSNTSSSSSSSVSPAVFVIPLAIAAALIVIGCCIRAQRVNTANARYENTVVSQPRDLGVPWTPRRPQAAPVLSPVSEDVLDPPPPYVPLRTLAPAYKPVNGTVERPADTERNVGNHGQARSMLDA